jgi:hypothetical protein
MGSHVYWLFFFVLLYWGYCITIGVRGYLVAKKGTDYFIAGRQLNIWARSNNFESIKRDEKADRHCQRVHPNATRM